jgi:hypothetical protein
MAATENNSELVNQLKQDIETWECQSVEFKKTATSDHELAEAIAGFATSNIGRIYIGVNDDGQITRVNNVSTGTEKDAYQQRIANISRIIVKPPIRVKISFIEIETETVVRIDVPKGEEPVYYVDYRPYTRDLSITRKLEPSEVRNLHRLQFLETLAQPPDGRTKFLTDVLTQLSDVQVIYSDYGDHLIKPDVYQLKYDIGATARRIYELSRNQFSKDFAVDVPLKELSDKLEDVEAYEFYMGIESVTEFGKKLEECIRLSNLLIQQIKKNMPPTVAPDFKRYILENTESLKDEWIKAPKYLERGDLEKLRDSFRRFGYTFHRLSALPDADQFENLSIDLKEVGEKLRNLSSTEKYFLLSMGVNPLDKIKNEIEPILSRLESLKHELESRVG